MNNLFYSDVTVFFQFYFDKLPQPNFVAGIWKNIRKLSGRWKFVCQFDGYVWNFFFFFYLLSCLSSFLIVYSKMYASFTPTILVADECRDAIMETTFLPKSPHVYSDPYLWKIFLSAGVGLASEVPSKLIQKQPPEVFYKKRCS